MRNLQGSIQLSTSVCIARSSCKPSSQSAGLRTVCLHDLPALFTNLLDHAWILQRPTQSNNLSRNLKDYVWPSPHLHLHLHLTSARRHTFIVVLNVLWMHPCNTSALSWSSQRHVFYTKLYVLYTLNVNCQKQTEQNPPCLTELKSCFFLHFPHFIPYISEIDESWGMLPLWIVR